VPSVAVTSTVSPDPDVDHRSVDESASIWLIVPPVPAAEASRSAPSAGRA
jgi:hypothetical protein